MKDRTKPRRRVDTTLPRDIVARIDALIPLISTPGKRATRADVLRALVKAGLEEHRRAVPAAPSAPKGGAS